MPVSKSWSCVHFVLRLHEFVWHGTDPENKTRLVPGLSRFTQLTIIPDHFYYNVSLTPSSLTTSITTWVSHHPPWPLLLQRESHISHNTLSYLTSSITTWVSHFTQLTVIPDHLYYNVNLTFHTTHRHTWPLLLQRSLTFHTTHCHTLPLLLQCESHISHNWWVSHSHNSLSILTTSITTWVSHFTQREFLVSCESHISHNWPSHWPLWLQHESRITVIPDLFYCNMSGSLHAACRSANF